MANIATKTQDSSKKYRNKTADQTDHEDARGSTRTRVVVDCWAKFVGERLLQNRPIGIGEMPTEGRGQDGIENPIGDLHTNLAHGFSGSSQYHSAAQWCLFE